KEAGLKAVLSGLGADELLGGYPSFKREQHYRRISKMPGLMLRMAGFSPKDTYRKLSFLERKDPVGEYLFYRGYYSPSETSMMLEYSIKEVKDVLNEIQITDSVKDFAPGN